MCPAFWDHALAFTPPSSITVTELRKKADDRMMKFSPSTMSKNANPPKTGHTARPKAGWLCSNSACNGGE
jgi:hypothetical protein